MNILMVDDEEHTMSDHRAALRLAGHRVTGLTRLETALHALKASFNGSPRDSFDLVLIDLMMPGQDIPTLLLPCYQGIATRLNNQGQALGQWLWDEDGARCKHGRPIHCYFSNIPQAYCLHSSREHQEFCGASDFVLKKTELMPSQFSSALANIEKLWTPLKLQLPLPGASS